MDGSGPNRKLEADKHLVGAHPYVVKVFVELDPGATPSNLTFKLTLNRANFGTFPLNDTQGNRYSEQTPSTIKVKSYVYNGKRVKFELHFLEVMQFEMRIEIEDPQVSSNVETIIFQ